MTILNLNVIRIDGGTQSRDVIEQSQIDTYAEAMSRGDKFPAVTVFFNGLDYYLADGFNESALGFYVQGSGIGSSGPSAEGNFASGQMISSSGRNFYIVTTSEGTDLNFETGSATALSGKSVIGIGNGFITNYSVDASVGNFPTVKVSVEGLGFNVSAYDIVPTGSGAGTGFATGVSTPAINPTDGTKLSTGSGNYVMLPNPSQGDGVTALRPGDITLSFGAFTGTSANSTPSVILEGSDGINIQSVSLSLPMSRTPIERLGSRFAFARVVDFPIVSTMTVNALVNEQQARNLADMIDDNAERDITLTINSPGTSTPAVKYTFKAARFDSQGFSSDIGSNKSVDLSFSTQIGGPNDTIHGIFFSGDSDRAF